MSSYSQTGSPDADGSSGVINANTTREEFLALLAKAGITDLESFVKANLDKVVTDEDDTPGDATHAFIHSHFVCIRDSQHI